jgi:hypothetical protein
VIEELFLTEADRLATLAAAAAAELEPDDRAAIERLFRRA